MAHIKVGVRRSVGGAPAAPDDPKAVEFQAHWVQIGDHRLTPGGEGLIGVAYRTHEGGPGLVTVTLFCSSFETVDINVVPAAAPPAARAERLAQVVAEAQPASE